MKPVNPRGAPAAGAGPLVTIGCAVYNGEATLERALAAVVAQDYPHLEILVSDDCSTDGSLSICEDFVRQDPRIKILRNRENIGLTENFNLLITEATGQYFMWADQDDIRDKSFVSKAVAALEADPDAVLCHSHTGVFQGDPDDLKYIITLKGVDGVESRVLRYFMFLNYFSDTALYGLIRTSALKQTRLRRHLGAANSLLFELLLLGKFIQIPEVLYLYSSRGTKKRPDATHEYARLNPGKKMPAVYFPFLVVAFNQTKAIGRAPTGWIEKLGLGTVLWGHTSVVAMTKLVYRSIAKPFPNVPDLFTTLCDSIVEPKGHLVILNDSDRDEEIFPKGWAVKGGD